MSRHLTPPHTHTHSHQSHRHLYEFHAALDLHLRRLFLLPWRHFPEVCSYFAQISENFHRKRQPPQMFDFLFLLRLESLKSGIKNNVESDLLWPGPGTRTKKKQELSAGTFGGTGSDWWLHAVLLWEQSCCDCTRALPRRPSHVSVQRGGR